LRAAARRYDDFAVSDIETAHARAAAAQ
jgi:hypothetical protein